MDSKHNMDSKHSMDHKHSMNSKHSVGNEHGKKGKTTEDTLYLIGIVIFPIILIFVALAVLQPKLLQSFRLPPCLFHFFTGYYCPGCGGSRAVWALIHGKILLSFYYHPFVPYAAAAYLCFMATQTIERISGFQVGMRFHVSYAWIATAIIMVNFVVKNMLHSFYGFIL